MKPRIAILERIHDAGVERLDRFASVAFLPGLDGSALREAVASCAGIVVKGSVRVDSALLAAAPGLRVIGRAGTGLDNIDVEAAARRNIAVVSVPAGNTVSAAEFTVALILMLSRRLPEAAAAVSRNDFRRHLLEGREMAAMTVGLVGLGNVGFAVSERLAAFGCRLVAFDPWSRNRAEFEALGGRLIDRLEALMGIVDILSFHVPLNADTRGMLNGDSIAHIRPGCLVVNTSRGPVIDCDALVHGLGTGQIAAAAVDVIDPEPPFDADPDGTRFEHPLLRHERVLVTPHMAASTEDAQRRIAVQLAEQMEASLLPAAKEAASCAVPHDDL